MSVPRAKTLRHLRHDLFTLALVAAAPFALAFVFPYEAIGFRAAEPPPKPAVPCAFVSLDADEARAALAAARTAWQVDATGVRGMRTDLSSGDLPPVPTRPVVPVRAPRGGSAANAPYTPNALPPTVAAPPPGAIAAEASPLAKPPAFPRAELLKIE